MLTESCCVSQADEAEVIPPPAKGEPKGEIPIPGVNILSTYIEESDRVAGFNRPSDYVTFKAVRRSRPAPTKSEFSAITHVSVVPGCG
jgi:hypothetical protein